MGMAFEKVYYGGKLVFTRTRYNPPFRKHRFKSSLGKAVGKNEGSRFCTFLVEVDPAGIEPATL